MLLDDVKRITQRLCDLEEEMRLYSEAIYSEASQVILREYVTDRAYPPDERFEVWSRFCKKEPIYVDWRGPLGPLWHPPNRGELTLDDVKRIIQRLCDLKEGMRLYSEASQVILREYVTNRAYPLDGRFEVWSRFCEKEHIYAEWEGGGLIAKLIAVDESLGRDVVTDLCLVNKLNIIRDAPDEWPDLCDVTEADVREAIIETNFGSCWVL